MMTSSIQPASLADVFPRHPAPRKDGTRSRFVHAIVDAVGEDKARDLLGEFPEMHLRDGPGAPDDRMVSAEFIKYLKDTNVSAQVPATDQTWTEFIYEPFDT